jgi:hypothetical protein
VIPTLEEKLTDLGHDSAANRFVLKATVYPSEDSAGFGDVDLPTLLCWAAAPKTDCGNQGG